MFESAELGRRTSREDFKKQEPVLRTGVLTVQYELREADFPVVLVIAGTDRLGCTDLINVLHVDADHRDWIDILSMSQGAISTKKSVACSDLSVMKYLDRSGPALWAAAAIGQVFPEMRLEIVKEGETPVVVYDVRLTSAKVTSISTSGSSELPVESLFLLLPVLDSHVQSTGSEWRSRRWHASDDQLSISPANNRFGRRVACPALVVVSNPHSVELVDAQSGRGRHR
jgi:type VI protein secretion system component Hcp